MYTDMCGIQYDVDSPAFKHFYLAPHPDKSLPKVSAEYESDYGTIKVDMEYAGNDWIYKASVPANTSATVQIPCTSADKVTVNNFKADAYTVQTNGVKLISFENGIATFEVLSGSYTFSVALK